MIINDKFESGIHEGAAAIVFWAAPVTIKGVLTLEDHQNTYMAKKTLAAVSSILKQDGVKVSDVNGWAIWDDFYLIHSPQWPADPTRNLMILQSNSRATGADSEVMIDSMKELLDLQLDGPVYMSWPSVMVATSEALEWVYHNAPATWHIYVPEEYVEWDTGLAELHAIADATTCHSVWPNGPSCARSGLNYQKAVLRAYIERIAAGDDVDEAFTHAWQIARNNT